MGEKAHGPFHCSTYQNIKKNEEWEGLGLSVLEDGILRVFRYPEWSEVDEEA